MLAAQNGHLDTLKWLVEAKGGDIRAKTKVTPCPFSSLSPFRPIALLNALPAF